MFEAAYSLGEHVTGEEEKELPALTPVLRWKKGQKIAQKNQVPETRDWDPRWQVYVHNNSPGGMGARGWAHPLLGLPFPICKMMKCVIWGFVSNNHAIETH